MADTKISALTALTGAGTANDDLLVIVDTSATQTKKITLTELQSAPVSAGTANGILYLNGSKVASSGSALVFDGSNLGIGVTPSAWNANAKAMQISSAATFWGISNNQAYVGSNSFYDSVGNFKYIASDSASQYRQWQGEHAWFTAPSGTAGNAISFTQAMTLDASGNLGIGTSSPGAKLHVNGEAMLCGDANNGVRFVKSGSVNYIQAANAGAASEIQIGNWYGDGFLRLDASGNLIQKLNGTAPTLSTNSTMSFELTSNTSLKIVVRGSDGTTRSASLTLA